MRLWSPLLFVVACCNTSTVLAASYNNASQTLQPLTTGITVTYGNNTYAQTALTPFAFTTSVYWSQFITPAILGTVYIIINNHNQTETVTSTNSAAVANNTQFYKNGTLSLLTRTDVDAAGTVTATVYVGLSSSTVLTYPTNYFSADESVYYSGWVPTPSYGTICCLPGATTLPAPTHSPFHTPIQTVDPDDPRGWLYTITEIEEQMSGVSNVSSLFTPGAIPTVIQSCPHPLCANWATLAAASAVQEVGALLATSTVHVTDSASSSATPAASPQHQGSTNTASSVEVGPITASVTSGASPSAKTSAPPAESEVASSSEQATSSNNAGSAIVSLLGIHATTISTGPASPPASSQKTIESTTQGDTQASNPPDSSQTTVLPTIPGNTQGSKPSVVSSASPPPLIVGSNTVTADSSSHYIVAGQTLTPGSSLTIGSGSSTMVVILQTSGSQTLLVVGSSTSALAASATTQISPPSTPAPIVVGSSTISANSASQYVVSGQTLAPGSSITLGNGASTTVVGLQTSGSQTLLVIGSSTCALPTSAPPSPAHPGSIVIGGSTITANSASQYVVSGQTLAPGSPITLGSGSSTTAIELTTSGSQTFLIVGGSTSSLSPATGASLLPVISLGSSLVSANSASEYIVGSQTLSPGGPAITISGTQYSLVSGATELVVGTSTEVLTTGAGGIASYILSALGGTSSASSTTGTESSGLLGTSVPVAGTQGASSTAPKASQTGSSNTGAELRVRWSGMCLSLGVLAVVLL